MSSWRLKGLFVCLFVYAGPRSYKYILQPPVMGCPYAGILPQAQEQFYWSSSRPWCCGPWYKEGKGCLIQCSTIPNITCITGRYDYTCPGHIHWGLVYFAVMLAFNGRSWPRGHWWWIKSQSGTWKFSFCHEDVISLRGFDANLGIESPNWIKGPAPTRPRSYRLQPWPILGSKQTSYSICFKID